MLQRTYAAFMSRLRYFVSGCVALVALSLSPGCGTLQEVSELIEEGGEEVLREPMRPIRGTTRVLLIGLDGVGEDVLQAAIDRGDLPALSALMGPATGERRWEHAYAATEVASVLPSETAAGWAAVFTGRTPAETGVAGNEWFDRDSLRMSAPVPLSVRSIRENLEIYSDNRIGEIIQTPTLFERAGVRSHVAMAFVHRGADLLNPPDLNDFGDLISAAFRVARRGSRRDLYEALDYDTWEGVERGVERYGVPDLQVANLASHGVLGLCRTVQLGDGSDGDRGGLSVSNHFSDLRIGAWFFSSARQIYAQPITRQYALPGNGNIVRGYPFWVFGLGL